MHNSVSLYKAKPSSMAGTVLAIHILSNNPDDIKVHYTLKHVQKRKAS